MLPKTQLRLSGLNKKVANGHCTAAKRVTNISPETAETSHGFQLFDRAQNQSSATAGTMSSRGNSGGIRCVTGWYTGPSFGWAETNGRIHKQPIRKTL